jgi:RHS repeat-associated protein
MFQWTGGTLGAALGSTGTLTNAPTGFIGVNPGSGKTAAIMTGGLALAGTIDVESGALDLDVPTIAGSNASFVVAQGATFDLTASVVPTYTGAFTGSGAGTVALNGVIFIGVGGATFNFAPGLFQWTGGGTIDESIGDLTNLGTITLAGSATKQFGSGATLENKGTIIQTGTGSLELFSTNPSFPTTLQNDAGALYEIEGDASIVSPNGQTVINNAGTIEKTAGTGTSTIVADGTLSNTGTIEAETGTVALSATIAQVSSGTLTGGTWNALGGATLQFPSGTSITTNQANVTMSGKGASIPALTSLTSNTGSLTVTGGATLSTTGNLSNTGTLTVGPGSTLTVGGTFTQGAAGTLDIGFGAGQSGPSVGLLAVTGAATLGGALQSQFASGFAPTVGQSIPIITFASSTGSFASTSSPIFKGGSVFQFQTNATNVTFTAAASVAELDVTTATATPSPVPVGQNLTVNYSVQNAGNATSVSSWVDSVFLSSAPAINSSSVLLGQVTHSGAVAAGGTYSGTLKAPVPAIAPGSYFVIVEVDSQGFVAQSNRSGNVLATTSAVQVTVPSLALAAAGTTPTPAAGTLAAGQSAAFEVQVPAGQTIQLSASFNSANAGELLAAFGTLPTPSANLAQASAPGQSQQTITLSNTQQGTYFVVLVGQPSAGSGTPFTLTAQEQPFRVGSFSPTTGSNAGTVTVTVSGALFSPATTVSLVSAGGKATPALGVTFENSTTLEAAFNLAGLSAGNYTLKAQNGSVTSTAAAPFVVTTGNPGQLALHVSVPSPIRPGRPVPVTVEYQNTGSTDIAAPIIELSANTGELELNGQANFTTSGAVGGGPNIDFLGTNPNGLAGVLPPGAQGEATFTFIGTVAASSATFKVAQMDSGGILAWATMQNQLRPPTIDSATWSVIFRNFLGEMGATTDQFQLVMDEDADYFQSIGEPTQDVSRLLNFELEEAGDFGAIAARNQLGAFGLGIPDTVTNVAMTSATTGNVAIQLGGGVEQFTKLANGSYQAQPGDTATLALVNGAYQLTELNGTVAQFNPNGTLAFLEAPNGQKLTAAYNSAGRLASLTDSLGNVTSYAYNSQNLVSQITAANGLVTSFTYDSSDRLTSITTPTGTTSFGYIGDPGFGDNNALQEITYPNGSHEFFVYDPLGRLIETFADDGTDRVGYQYDLGPGEIQISNAVGDAATYFLDDTEQVARLIDPLGNVYETQFDANHNAIGVSLPQNLTATLRRDGLGDPTQATNPLGATTSFTFGNFNELASTTDPNGNTYGNSYDASGNLLSTAFPDGTTDSYTYQANGLLASATNRAGQTMTYTYNANGTLASETVPGVGTDSYTYDSHLNLLTTTDATGTTTYTYNAADQVTSVTYPGGQELTFTYNAQTGQRESMTDVASNYTVNYSYTTLGQLSQLTDGHGNVLVSYTYNDAGQLVQETLGNGTSSTYVYDAGGDLLDVTNLAADGTTVLSSYSYTYDTLGNPLTMTTSAGTTTYGYDASGQLISVALPGGQTITYAYDADGNRISETHSAGGTTAYTTNSDDEYTKVGGTALQYDANGDLLYDGTNHYTYNALGELTGVQTPTDTYTFSYDAQGHRVGMTDNGTATSFVIDPGTGELAAQMSGGQTTQDIFGLALVGQISSGSSLFYGFDGTGNTSVVTGAGGAVLDTYSYLPFGESLSTTGTTPNLFTFSGALGVISEPGASNSSAFDLMTNRAYSPALGRFTSPDPTGFDGGNIDLYVYAGNSPVVGADPTGLNCGQLAGGTPALSGTAGDVTALTGTLSEPLPGQSGDAGGIAQSGALAGGRPALSGGGGDIIANCGALGGGLPALSGGGGDIIANCGQLGGGLPALSGGGGDVVGNSGQLSGGLPALSGGGGDVVGDSGKLGGGLPALSGGGGDIVSQAGSLGGGAPVLAGSPAGIFGGTLGGVPDPSLGDGNDNGFNSDGPGQDPLITAPSPDLSCCTLGQPISSSSDAAAAVLALARPLTVPPPSPGKNEKVLPNGVIIIKNADGTTTELYPIATVSPVDLNAQGILSSVRAAGDNVAFGNGLQSASITLRIGPATEVFVTGGFTNAQGVLQTPVISSTQSNADGTKTITYTNGTTETVIIASGEATFRFPNGITMTAVPTIAGGIDLHIQAVTLPDGLTIALGGPITDPSQITITTADIPTTSGGTGPIGIITLFPATGAFSVLSVLNSGGTSSPDGGGLSADPTVTHNANGSVTTSTQTGPNAPGPFSNTTVVTTDGTDGTDTTTTGTGVDTQTDSSGNTTFTLPDGTGGDTSSNGVGFTDQPDPPPNSPNQCLPPPPAPPPPCLDCHAPVAANNPITTIINTIVSTFNIPHDPNNLVGPMGFGSQGFVAPGQVLGYTINFENDPTAKGAAAVVVVTQQLSPNLNLNTFQLGAMGFGSIVVPVPAGLTSYSTELTLKSTAPGAGPNGLIVDISAGLSLQTGLLTWTFTSKDPATLDIPINPAEGFLPPDNSAGAGEGFVSYTIQPKASDATGTAINAQASVVFDTNSPINTPSVTNTIDATVPTSSVAPLPATTTNSKFTVSWSGSNGAGSGIATYNVFVSTNGGAFVPFQVATPATSAAFTGVVGDTYSFYSVATSNVGLVQPTPTAGQATTEVVKVTVPPPAIVTSVKWTTVAVKTGSGKKAKTKSEPALQITFSEPVSGAASLGDYELFSVTTKTVKKKRVTTLSRIGLGSVIAASSPRTTSVKLVPSGKIKPGQTTELEIIAADITDAEGRALDGNDDGKPGGNFIGKFGSGGLTFARPGAVAAGASARLSPVLVDALIGTGEVRIKAR